MEENTSDLSMTSQELEVNKTQKRLKKEFTILKSIIEYPRVKKVIADLRQDLYHLEGVALKKDSQGAHMMDKYLPLDIMKRFNGLEIHNLHKAFSKFQDGLTLDSFLILSIRILDINREEAPYAVLGMINLFESLTRRRGKNTLQFQDFLNNFMKMQSITTDNKQNNDDEDKGQRFHLSQHQDSIHHDQPIKSVQNSSRLKIIFSLDELCSHIRAYSYDAELKFKLKPQTSNHGPSALIITEFTWAEPLKAIVACYQDSKLGFFIYEENSFTPEMVYTVPKSQCKIWYINYYKKYLMADYDNMLSLWNDRKKTLEEFMQLESKISDLVEMPPLKVIAVATFDRQILLISLEKKLKFLSIKLKECSAHTLRYSIKQNLLFVGTFEANISIYSVDVAKDYTKVGKLDHFFTVAAIELFDEENILISCDEEGNIKSWDTRSFKNIQQSSMGSYHKPTKIIGARKARKFCVVTNRLNYFAFDKVGIVEKLDQALPGLRFDHQTDELTVCLTTDIRVVNMKYGILSEIMDKELWNIGEKLSYIKKIKELNSLFFLESEGAIKQITYSTDKSHAPFRPYKHDNVNIIFDNHYNLLVVWSRSNIKIYRYLDKNEAKKLREINFSGSQGVTGVRVYREKYVLATIINNTHVIFWEFHKIAPYRMLTNNPNDIHDHTESDRKKKNRKSEVIHANNPPHRKESTIVYNRKQSIIEDNIFNLHENTQPQKPIETEKTSKENNAKLEINDILFLKGFNCFLMIDGRYDFYLIGHQNFDEFKVKIKLEYSEKPDRPDYIFSKISKRSICLEPFIKENIIMLEDIEDVYNNDQETQKVLNNQQHYIICADSLSQITVLNINSALAKYFSIVSGGEKSNNPFHCCDVNMDDHQYDTLLEKSKKYNQHLEPSDEHKFTITKYKVWKAHDVPIIDFKFIEMTGPMIITLGQDNWIKLWTISGILVGKLYPNDIKKSEWNVQKYTDHQRILTFQKVKTSLDEILEKFYNKSKTNSLNILDGDPEAEERVRRKKKERDERKNMAYVTNKTNQLLERDYEFFGDENYNKVPFHMQMNSNRDKYKDLDRPKQDQSSSYTEKLAKKLEKKLQELHAERKMEELENEKLKDERIERQNTKASLSKFKSGHSSSLPRIQSKDFIKSMPEDKFISHTRASSIKKLDYIDYYGTSTPTIIEQRMTSNESNSTKANERLLGFDRMTRTVDRKSVMKNMQHQVLAAKNKHGSVDLKVKRNIPEIFTEDNTLNLSKITHISSKSSSWKGGSLVRSSFLNDKPHISRIMSVDITPIKVDGDLISKNLNPASVKVGNDKNERIGKTKNSSLFVPDKKIEFDLTKQLSSLEKMLKKYQAQSGDGEFDEIYANIEQLKHSRSKMKNFVS